MKLKKFFKLFLITQVWVATFVIGWCYAASGTAYLFQGSFPSSNIADLRYVMNGGTTYYQQNIMKPGIEAWNGVSSKVRISYNTSGTKISTYQSTTTQPNLQGRMYPYYIDGNGNWVFDVNAVNIWYCADIYGYDNNMWWNDYSGGTITRRTYTDAQKKMIYTHEMGHALSLAHNNTKDTVTGKVVIMNDSSTNNIVANVLTPQNDDKANIRLKWGC